MFRCNQCIKSFEDHTSIRRHLSIKHFNYSPYSCKICKKMDQFHLTATEEDMNTHFETVHPGTKPSITLSRETIIEDKIKAVIDGYQIPISRCMVHDFKIDSHQECNAPNNQSSFSTTATKSESSSSHVIQEQSNGERIENIAADDIEIVFESVPQKVKDQVGSESGSNFTRVKNEQNKGKTTENAAVGDIEVVSNKVKNEDAVSKNISLDLKNALRRAYNVLCEETVIDASAKEVDCLSSEVKQELSNNDATGNIAADKNNECSAVVNAEDSHMTMVLQPGINNNLLETTLESQNKHLNRDFPTMLATESNPCANDASIFALPELQSLQRFSITSNATQSHAQFNPATVSDETFNKINEENSCQDSTSYGQSTAMTTLSVEETVIQNERNSDEKFNKKSCTNDVDHDSPATESNLSVNDAPIFALSELQSLQGPPNFREQLNSAAVSDETFNQIDEENIRQDSTHSGQSTAMPIPSVKENVFSNVQNTDEEFNEHVPIELGIQTRLRRSSNKHKAKIIRGKRTLAINEGHSRLNISAKRSNPKKTNSTEKIYKCKQCHYASARKDTLDRHVRIHTVAKPFKCSICSFASATISSLEYHMRTHTGEKPYKCNKCPYASGRRTTLMTHMRIHTCEKPFKCSICSYACATRHSLNVHNRTHTDEKPNKCFKCAFAGIQSSRMQDHVRRHHSMEMA